MLRRLNRVMVTVAALSALVMVSQAGAADKLVVMGTDGTTKKFVVTDTGNVGINTATPTGGSLHIVATDTPVLNDILGNNQTAGMGVDISTPTGTSPSGPVQAANWSFLVKYNNAGAGITNNFNTFRMIARSDASVSEPITGQFAAANFMAQHQGSNTATYVVGFVTNAALRGTGNIIDAVSVDAASAARIGTGTITNAKGVRIRAQKATGVTNGYGVYQEGAADINYFAGKVQLPNLPVYANNALAIAGGLSAGTLYRTGGDPDVVAVVH